METQERKKVICDVPPELLIGVQSHLACMSLLVVFSGQCEQISESVKPILNNLFFV